MAINKNHLFDELNGIKSAIVESGISRERADFLVELLKHNGYEVVLATDPPPKPKHAPKPRPGEVPPIDPPVEAPEPPAPATYTVGVTDLTFSAVSAIFGRRLKAPNGHIVTQAYWHQKEAVSHDEVPYYENKAMHKE